MSTLATRRDYSSPLRAFDREAMIKSLLASMLLAGFIALAFVVGEAVQESRAGNHIVGAKQQPERSGVLSAQMLAF